jgi:hypothetical protein
MAISAARAELDACAAFLLRQISRRRRLSFAQFISFHATPSALFSDAATPAAMAMLAAATAISAFFVVFEFHAVLLPSPHSPPVFSPIKICSASARFSPFVCCRRRTPPPPIAAGFPQHAARRALRDASAAVFNVAVCRAA